MRRDHRKTATPEITETDPVRQLRKTFESSNLGSNPSPGTRYVIELTGPRRFGGLYAVNRGRTRQPVPRTRLTGARRPQR